MSFWIFAGVFFTSLLPSFVDCDGPRLSPQCPEDVHGLASIRMSSDHPAFALAKCQNGDRPFTSRDNKDAYMTGVLKLNADNRECEFYKKGDDHVFTLDVEIGWGDDDSVDPSITHKRIHTLSCVYDSHGKALTFSQSMTDGRIDVSRQELKFLSSESSKFDISVIDISNEEVLTDSIYMGKKIRLGISHKTNSFLTFRALTCVVKNAINSYTILKSGCGDGIIFKKTIGFQTVGQEVYSPYFEAFRLKGGDTLQFLCNFKKCFGNCNGDSCVEEVRRKQKLSPEDREREDMACSKVDPDVLIFSSDDPSDKLPSFSDGLQ